MAASTCRVAEVAATVAFVLGAERGAMFLSARGLAGVFTGSDGSKMRVGRWPTGVRDAA